jgi:hypothetical protein
MHRKRLLAWLLTYCLSSSEEQQKKITKNTSQIVWKLSQGNWFADSLPAVQVPSMGKKKEENACQLYEWFDRHTHGAKWSTHSLKASSMRDKKHKMKLVD